MKFIAIPVRSLMSICILVVLAATMSGCLRSVRMLIKPKPDGSGSFVYTMEMKKSSLDFFKEMGASQSNDAPDPEQSVPTGTGMKSEMQKTADSSNGQLKLQTFDYIIKSGDTLGVKAEFSFKDIRKLRMQDLFKSKSPLAGGSDDTSATMWSQFEFMAGNPSVLKVYSENTDKLTNFGGLFSTDTKKSDSPSKSSSKKGLKSIDSPFSVMVAEMLDSLEMNLSIEPQGKIVSTNATYREGNRITFASLDLTGVKQMTEAKKKNSKLAAKMEKAILSRMKVEKSPVVEIRFTN